MKNVYKPKDNSIEYRGLNIFLPFTDVQPATLISLIGYDYLPVKLEGDFGYSQFFRDRWNEGKTFINVEHDSVIYPGAIEALLNCPEELCAFDFHLPIHRQRQLIPGQAFPLGLIKISDSLIAKNPNFWNDPIKWDVCDQHLATLNIVHQHTPGIVNANPALLGFASFEEGE